MIENFERLLRQGVFFEIPPEGSPWVLYDSDDPDSQVELCRGNTLQEMMARAPGSVISLFVDLAAGDKFRYLDEVWIKRNAVSGQRFDDGCIWTFTGSTEVDKI